MNRKSRPPLDLSKSARNAVRRCIRIAVGFEAPLDAESANDTSWFALATECADCGLTDIAFDHETA